MATEATASSVYVEAVKPLPLSERLKLASMILNDIPPQAIVDYSEEWTEEDIRDFTQERVEALLIEGLDSGDPVEVTPEFWNQLWARVDARGKEGRGGEPT